MIRSTERILYAVTWKVLNGYLTLHAMDFCTFSATTGKLRSLQDENEQLKRALVPDPTLEGGVVCQ